MMLDVGLHPKTLLGAELLCSLNHTGVVFFAITLEQSAERTAYTPRENIVIVLALVQPCMAQALWFPVIPVVAITSPFRVPKPPSAFPTTRNMESLLEMT
ncbi:unnamed protein product [Pleuronectes platessa]|uniref:Uncharacterized protein n=1 Tax=Pleuronectes platessa TaxID=8262 RepID=A0A9N7UMR9_PLEPL|nr:unnamed protein product [Pleuronectes platessa]